MNCPTGSNRYEDIAGNGMSCKCKNNYWDDGTSAECQKCHFSCSSCFSSSEDSCSSCNTQMNRVLLPTSNVLIGKCICADNYYDNGGDELCMPYLYYY